MTLNTCEELHVGIVVKCGCLWLPVVACGYLWLSVVVCNKLYLKQLWGDALFL